MPRDRVHFVWRISGDYTWLAAYNRKVYGIWTEALPISPDSKQPQPGRLPRATTAVRVGFADFSTVE